MPALTGEMGSLYFGIERGGRRMLLQQFADRVMRYRAGRMEWEITDSRFPGLTVKLEATTLTDADGFTARMAVNGSKPGDQALWGFFPPEAGRGLKYQSITTSSGYQFDREPAAKLSQVQGRLSTPVTKWESIAFGDRENLAKAVPIAGDPPHGAGLIAFTPLSDNQPQSVAVACDENDLPGYAKLVLRKRPLDPAAIADPSSAFDLGFSRMKSLGERLTIDTPDPYLNAGARASVAAAAGAFVNPTFVHGGSAWRQQQPGWRTMGGAIYYGWLDQVQRAVKFWGDLQVKENGAKTHSGYSENGCQQAGNSRFFGAGFIDYKQPPHYEFQTQFFDEAIRAWRATADPALEKMLLPTLELHLQRCKECFDPNGDGIYESYNNTWPSDSVWFNGGGTPEQSGYVYYGHRAAADLCRRAGDASGAARHNAIAEFIRKAVNDRLWMPERGCYASCVEGGGHKRQMPDAWIYAEHVPIEAGLATPEQAWKAMFYTEWAMERTKLPYGGEMRQTSNFVPGQWSIRELYQGDNFAMALGYFLAGQGDEGWELLRGTMLESMYGDGVPKSGYSSSGANFVSPGGLSHPNCSMDFTDIISAYARCLIEGLFGYRPDYPNQTVRMEPSFPSSWDHASVRTPDFTLEFKANSYRLTLTKAAAVKFGIPVRAAKVRDVTINGKPARFTIEPWAGYGMLRLDVPVTNLATIVLDTENPTGPLPALVVEQPDGVPGYRLRLNKKEGDVPRYQFTKVHVPAPENPKVLCDIPRDAKWNPLDISTAFNGDIRTIFKQRYESPRPDRVSMRIAYDGWAAWTFTHWSIKKAPEIGLENALDGEAKAVSPALLIHGNRLITPQGVPFPTLNPARNIAFTSLWDNWPHTVTVPINAKGEAVWLLVCGSTTPMQGKIANAVLRFRYADGKQEQLDLVPPDNFWSLCKFGRTDYNYKRDGFSLPKNPPSQVQLGANCRAMLYGWKLPPGVALQDITLETLSQDVVIGLMGVSVMN